MNDERSPDEARAIDEQMAAALERRQRRPERRRRPQAIPADRRKVCSFCFQPGDHPTPAHCLRALERG